MATLYYLAPLRLNDSTGAAAPNVTVGVGSTTVYQDPAGLVPYPNNTPVTDALGEISFYAPTGTYTLTYTPANGVAQSVTVTLPAGLAAASSTGIVNSTQDGSLRDLLGNPAVTIRSNMEINTISGPAVDTAGASVAASGVMVAVPVPVDVGMTVSRVSFLVGATAASTPTHSFGAIYSGTTVASPPLIGQSTDGSTAAVAASTRFDFNLTTPTVITSAMAPSGYIWAAFGNTATTTLPSILTLPCGAAAGQYRWFTNTPLYWSLTSGSAGRRDRAGHPDPRFDAHHRSHRVPLVT